VAFDVGVAHYGPPPPDELSDVVKLRKCMVASMEAEQLDRAALQELSKGRRREKAARG
jgi:hypothetical protein